MLYKPSVKDEHEEDFKRKESAFIFFILCLYEILGVYNAQVAAGIVELTVAQESHQALTTLAEKSSAINNRNTLDPASEIKRLESFIIFLSISLSIVGFILLFIYTINKRLQKAVNKQTTQLLQLNQDLKIQQQNTADSVIFKEQILDNIDTGIVTFNMKLLITSCNKKALEMLAFSSSVHYHFQHSELLESILAHYRLNGEKELVSHLLEINEDGKKKMIYFKMLHMFNARGEQTGYLLSMDDETEKKA